MDDSDLLLDPMTDMNVDDASINPNPIVTNPLNPAIDGTAGNDGLTGTNGDDVIRGRGGSDAIDGGAGNDFIDGGAGVDTAIYQFAPSGVSVDLNVGRANDGSFDDQGFVGVDTLSGIENVVGSEFGDIIVGNNEANSLSGGNGSDLLSGVGGSNFLIGGAGADEIRSGAGNDTLLYLNPSEGGDTVFGFETGSDKIQIVGALFPSDLSGGTLSSEQFFSGSEALDANDRFGYDSSTGEVLFDADGSGGGSAITLATLFVNRSSLDKLADFSNTDITIL